MDSLSELSYLHSPSVKSNSYTTVTRLAKENARLRPNQELFIYRQLDGSRSSLTNVNLYQQSEQLARYLVTQGIKKGDVVALVGPNTLEMAIGTLGIMLAGAVVLNVIITMKTSHEMKALFQLTRAKYILVDCGENNCLLDPAKSMLDNCNVQTGETSKDDKIKVMFLRKTNLDGFKTTENLKNILSYNMDEVNLPQIYPEDDAVIFTTSGSTGKPKMVLHSHLDFACYPFSLIPSTVDYNFIFFNDRPFGWSGGTPVSDIARSQTRIFMDPAVSLNTKNIDFLWRVLEEEGCTDALLAPFVIYDLIESTQKDTKDRFKLQHIFTGGQMIDSYYTRIIGTFCHAMAIVYASTEGNGITLHGPIDPTKPLPAGDVGLACPGVEIRVVDSQELPIERGLIGKIQIRSLHLMKEYVGCPQLTKEAFTTDRWFRTGDIGKVSSNGHLILLGRETEAIKRGTRKIYPAKLEFLLKKMKSVKEVCVVPVPDRRLYEEICVCFVPSGELTPDDVQQYCEQNLFTQNTVDSLGEMPTYFLQFEVLSKLGTGKPDKKAIQVDATQRLGLTEIRA